MGPVAVGDAAHGGEDLVSGVCERLCGVAAEATASPGDEDVFEHDGFFFTG